MTNVSKLKTSKSSGPPPEDEAPGNIANAPRDKADQQTATPPAPTIRKKKKVAKGKIEFSVDQAIIDAFCACAAKEFGFKKGSKSKMFEHLWHDYQQRR